jgi:hypothetical protein
MVSRGAFLVLRIGVLCLSDYFFEFKRFPWGEWGLTLGLKLDCLGALMGGLGPTWAFFWA